MCPGQRSNGALGDLQRLQATKRRLVRQFPGRLAFGGNREKQGIAPRARPTEQGVMHGFWKPCLRQQVGHRLAHELVQQREQSEYEQRVPVRRDAALGGQVFKKMGARQGLFGDNSLLESRRREVEKQQG